MHKDANKWTKEDFKKLKRFEWTEKSKCLAIVVIPEHDVHDSGYRNMSFALFDDKGNPLGRVGGGSDVIHIEGIGGFGYKWLDKVEKKGISLMDLKPPLGGWSIDCLAKSGYIRLFCKKPIIIGPALSSFEIFSSQGDENV